MRRPIPPKVRELLRQQLEERLDRLSMGPGAAGLMSDGFVAAHAFEGCFKDQASRKEWTLRIRLVQELSAFLNIPLGRADARLDEIGWDPVARKNIITAWHCWSEVLPRLEAIIANLNERDRQRRLHRSSRSPCTG